MRFEKVEWLEASGLAAGRVRTSYDFVVIGVKAFGQAITAGKFVALVAA
jgi:hypothetical protein